MTTTTLKKLNSRQVSYLGVPAMLTEYRTAGAMGLRGVAILWLDDADRQEGQPKVGDVSVKVVAGDGRKPSFIRHASAVLRQPTAADVDAWIAEQIESAR